MKTNFLVALLLTILLSAGCSNPSASTEPTTAPRETKTNKEEIVLSPEQQASAKIETQEVSMSKEPEMLRVKGRIALDDDRVWRVGVRTLGSVMRVYANLGDHVKKGQILARYHADEVRDSRAVPRNARGVRSHEGCGGTGATLPQPRAEAGRLSATGGTGSARSD